MQNSVKPLPSTLTTMNVDGSNLSSNSKSLTYSHLLQAIKILTKSDDLHDKFDTLCISPEELVKEDFTLLVNSLFGGSVYSIDRALNEVINGVENHFIIVCGIFDSLCQ